MPGYEDYQRLVNYDSANIVTESGVAIEKNKVLGRFFVSRYGFLLGKLQFASQPVKVTFQWFAAETGGEPLGERSMRFDNLTAVSAQICLPHLGPWLQITYEPESLVTKYTPVVRLLNSNRALPFGGIPTVPYVLVATPFKLASKAVKEFRPQAWYSGPAMMMARQLSGGTVSMNVQAMLNGFEYNVIYAGSGTAGFVVANVILPATAQLFAIANESAVESEMNFTIIPTTTGSS